MFSSSTGPPLRAASWMKYSRVVEEEEEEESGVFDIQIPRFRNLRPLSLSLRRQFPLRSKIQIDRIMGIREEEIVRGEAWENVSRHVFDTR